MGSQMVLKAHRVENCPSKYGVPLGSLGGKEVHNTVKFEPPRTPRTQRSEATFIKPTISRIRTYSWGCPLDPQEDIAKAGSVHEGRELFAVIRNG